MAARVPWFSWLFTRRSDAPPRWSDPANRPLLLLGVFFTFMPMGLIARMIPESPGNWAGIAFTALFTGLMSVGWAAAFVLDRRWILVLVLPVQVLIPGVVFPALGRAGWFEGTTGLSPTAARAVLMAAAVFSTVIGYICAMRVTRRLEGTAARSKAELDIASAIHQSLVPDLDVAAGRLRILGASRASNTMGGDLIDVCAAGGRTDVILADVSGHGVGAGIVMGMLKSSARTLLRSAPTIERLLTDLNIVLSDLTRPEMFATMAVVRLHPSGAFEYCLAGHLPILHLRAASGDVVEHPNDALPLGIEPAETYTAGSAALEPGDTLLMLTDGLTEVQDAAGRELGLPALRDALRASAGRPLHEVRDALFDRAQRHGRALDDQSVLLIRLAAHHA